MKLRQILRGFTLIELLVVISIIAILAGVAIPQITPALEKANRMQDISKAKSIFVGLVSYAMDNDGAFPSTPPPTGTATAGVGTLSDANQAYKNICPQYIPTEATFYVPKSAWSPKKPDEVTNNGQNLMPGENQFAYVSGLTQTSAPNWPIIADGFAANGLPGGVYAADPSVPGGVWKGKFAVVVTCDGGAVALKCTEAMTVFGPTGQTAPANIFVGVNDPNNPWLSGTGTVVLNPAPVQ